MKKKLIVLTGPTAVGKTELSISLAKAVNGEIISADSMQVYRHMDIGSAKIMPEEMDGIRHHLIDVLEPWEEFNVTRFQAMAREAMEGIYARGHVPIVTGGTGFYIQALAYGIDFTENEDTSHIREELEQEAKEKGNLIDATYGRKTRCVIVMDNGHVVLSPNMPETIGGRLAAEQKGSVT